MFGELRFLIVDDHLQTRIVIREILTGLGVRMIEEAASVSEALVRLEKLTIDVLISDLMLKDITGVDLAGKVRRGLTRARPTIPIVMVSAHLDRVQIIGARNAGVSEFVAKPVDLAVFKHRLEAAILRPRPFIQTASYRGPDRRIKPEPPPSGINRRKSERELAMEMLGAAAHDIKADRDAS